MASDLLKEQKERNVGLTKDEGYQIGARKTFDIAPQAAWDALTSPRGLRIWLGEDVDLPPQRGASYQTKDGASGVVRVYQPGSHVRLTWQPAGWEKPSLVQLRVIPSGSKTVISFHQDQLIDADQRERMRQRWHQVLRELAELFA